MQSGFSADGYIIDQNCFHDYPYRTIRSDCNGCGWIAAYNLRHALGQDAAFDDVRSEMDGMFLLRIPGPTTMRVMRAYLRRYVTPECTVRRGRAAVRAAAVSRAGILRYWEEQVPHFVAYVRREDGQFRFFNAADGLEDYFCPMETFIATRCAHGPLCAITVS